MFESSEVEYLNSGYASDRGKPAKPYRLMRLNEVSQNARAHITDRYGNVRQVKITSMKTWKRRPGDMIVRWKYGLYEYGESEFISGSQTSFNKLLVPVEE